MVTVEKKLRLLEIDTKFIPPPPHSLSPCSEEEDDNTLIDSPILISRKSQPLATNSNKRYSASFLHHHVDIHNHQEGSLSSVQDSKCNGHKRSTSAGNESVLLPTNHSVPDFLSKRGSFDTKTCTKNMGNSTLKKRWFQLPRMTLKRQASTPPRRGYGGLEAGLVEPPQPPPQLLFNLDWSSTNSSSQLLWDSDVSNSSISTPTSPTSPIISRRSSGYGFDIILNDPNTAIAINNNGPNIPSDKMKLTRRLSCPNYENLLTSTTETESITPVTSPRTPSLTPNETLNNNHKLKLTTNSSKLFSNFQRPSLKRGVSNDGHGVIPSASSSTSSTASSSSASTPLSSPLTSHSEDYKLLLFNVYTPITNELVLNFSIIKARTHKLKRKTSPKIEQKALNVWRNQLLSALNGMKLMSPKDHVISPEKKARYFLTRKFILREFYTTEINFWNQLNYTKVMFSDPLQLALDRHSEMARASDTDWFANLHDLMNFSSALILRLRNAQIEKSPNADGVYKDATVDPNCQTCPTDVNVGLVLREMAEHMVIFLRCALDYRANKKLLNQRKHNKAYALYNEKLALRKETRQFTLHDYLIIPIQRITRYGLLLADLEKHTEATHPDYENIRIVRCIVHSLAAAMNSVQKK